MASGAAAVTGYQVLSAGVAMLVEGPATFCTPSLAVACARAPFWPVTVIGVVVFGLSGTLATKFPVVSVVGFGGGVTPATRSVAGSMFFQVPLTSIVVAPVCVAGRGEVMVMDGAPLATVTRTVATPTRSAALRQRAVMMLSPETSETFGTENVPPVGVKAMPFTSPDTTAGPTVPVPVTIPAA